MTFCVAVYVWVLPLREKSVEFTEKEGQILMDMIYSSWQNHSHLNLQILFSNTKNVIDQNGNRQSRSVKLKTYPDRLYMHQNNQNVTIYESRSYGGMRIKSDHKLVMTKSRLNSEKCQIATRFIKRRK